VESPETVVVTIPVEIIPGSGENLLQNRALAVECDSAEHQRSPDFCRNPQLEENFLIRPLRYLQSMTARPQDSVQASLIYQGK
jgi:hypothetical protein